MDFSRRTVYSSTFQACANPVLKFIITKICWQYIKEIILILSGYDFLTVWKRSEVLSAMNTDSNILHV